MVVRKEKRRTKRKRATAGAGMHWGSFREATGASGVHAGWLVGWVRPVQM